LHERIWHKVYKYKKSDSTSTTNNLTDINNNKRITIWITGLPCSGKSTLSNTLHSYLSKLNLKSYILDGDIVRANICSDLNFNRNDRRENIRRSAEIAKILNENDIIVIASFVSPYNEDRLLAKNIINNDNFFQIYVDTNLETCIKRDVKGMYNLAKYGEIENFTGISDVYEIPEDSDFHIVNNKYSFESLINTLNFKFKNSIIP
jgi:adenylyl-sulfate kinase